MNFISREMVLEVLDTFDLPPLLRHRIEKLPYFPAPNPDGNDGKNVMGQTEDEFWSLYANRED